MAWRSHELAGGSKGTGGTWTRLLGTRHQHRHCLNITTDLVPLWDVSSHRESSRELFSPPPRGLRANEAKEKHFVLWGNKAARQQMNQNPQISNVPKLLEPFVQKLCY